jgi:hypothetical protein
MGPGVFVDIVSENQARNGAFGTSSSGDLKSLVTR